MLCNIDLSSVQKTSTLTDHLNSAWKRDVQNKKPGPPRVTKWGQTKAQQQNLTIFKPKDVHEWLWSRSANVIWLSNSAPHAVHT